MDDNSGDCDELRERGLLLNVQPVDMSEKLNARPEVLSPILQKDSDDSVISVEQFANDNEIGGNINGEADHNFNNVLGVLFSNEVTPVNSADEAPDDISPPHVRKVKKRPKIHHRLELAPRKLIYSADDDTGYTTDESLKNDGRSFSKKKERKSVRKTKSNNSNLQKGQKISANPNKQETTKDRLLNWIETYSSSEYGIWVQCCNPSCLKWRWVKEYEEAFQVPRNWFCSMNKDAKKNNCLAPEDDWHNVEFNHSEFVPGSIVWAQLIGYPWWPAMVEDDPDLEEYYLLNDEGNNVDYYHVTFLDKIVTRSWIPASRVRRFLHKERLPKVCLKNRTICKMLEAAQDRAMEAINMSLQDRLKKYSFAFHFQGKWPPAVDDSDAANEGNSDKSALNETMSLLKEVEDVDSLDSNHSAKDETLEKALDETQTLLKEVEDLDSLDSCDFASQKKPAHSAQDYINQTVGDYDSFQQTLSARHDDGNVCTSTQGTQNNKALPKPVKNKLTNVKTAKKKQKQGLTLEMKPEKRMKQTKKKLKLVGSPCDKVRDASTKTAAMKARYKCLDPQKMDESQPSKKKKKIIAQEENRSSVSSPTTIPKDKKANCTMDSFSKTLYGNIPLSHNTNNTCTPLQAPGTNTSGSCVDNTWSASSPAVACSKPDSTPSGNEKTGTKVLELPVEDRKEKYSSAEKVKASGCKKKANSHAECMNVPLGTNESRFIAVEKTITDVISASVNMEVTEPVDLPSKKGMKPKKPKMLDGATGKTSALEKSWKNTVVGSSFTENNAGSLEQGTRHNGARQYQQKKKMKTGDRLKAPDRNNQGELKESKSSLQKTAASKKFKMPLKETTLPPAAKVQDGQPSGHPDHGGNPVQKETQKVPVLNGPPDVPEHGAGPYKNPQGDAPKAFAKPKIKSFQPPTVRNSGSVQSSNSTNTVPELSAYTASYSEPSNSTTTPNFTVKQDEFIVQAIDGLFHDEDSNPFDAE